MAFIYSGEYDHRAASANPATPRRPTLRRLNARGRIALARVDGFLHFMIAALTESKIRRIQRELALRGVRYDGITASAPETRE